MLIEKVCEVCGVTFSAPHWRKNAKYCSKECQHKSLHAEPNAVCCICGKAFHVKPTHLKRFNVVTCSMECSKQWRSIAMSGECNHQYGLRGELNASFKQGDLIHGNHGLTDIMVYVGSDYPKANENGRIPLHRYLVEQNHTYFPAYYFEEIDGKMYLKDGVSVHHKDGNHDNNALENLEPLTKSEHTALHNKSKRIIRDKKNGRILGIQAVVKLPIKRLYEDSKLPFKKHDTDAGYDLYAHSVEMDREGNMVYGTGIAVSIPAGYVGLVFSRSSIANYDLYLSNSAGVIDCGYTAEILCKFRPTEDEPKCYQVGDRIAQLIILPYPKIEFEEVQELTETERGEGGYGSTGK